MEQNLEQRMQIVENLIKDQQAALKTIGEVLSIINVMLEARQRSALEERAEAEVLRVTVH